MALKHKLKRTDLLYPELSYQIVGVLFTVSNEMGYGYQEKYYQRATRDKLAELGLKFREQVPAKIIFQGNKIGVYFLDFVIEDKIALEIKRRDKFSRSDVDQLYAYLKTTGLKLGILATFTRRGLEFKRIVNLYS